MSRAVIQIFLYFLWIGLFLNYMISVNFNHLKGFNHHKFVISVYDNSGNLAGFIAIHRGNHLIPSFGATRIWKYSSQVDALRDALRLSRLMSYKSALAGLNYGGAKAVLIDRSTTKSERRELIKTYTQKVNYLRGSFITGADVGVNLEDLKLMRSESKFIVGLNTDPVQFTMKGIYYALKVCLREVFGSESLKERSFAIQGLGKTGYSLLQLLYKDAQKIIVCDIDDKKLELVKKEFPNVEVVLASKIFEQKVDVYCPCALGNTFTMNNVSNLQCKIICGSANNQLEKCEVGDLLYKNGILYAPDYVVNAGGLIAVAEEYEHPNLSTERISKRVLGIRDTLKLIIRQSKRTKSATNRVADRIAERIFNGL